MCSSRRNPIVSLVNEYFGMQEFFQHNKTIQKHTKVFLFLFQFLKVLYFNNILLARERKPSITLWNFLKVRFSSTRSDDWRRNERDFLPYWILGQIMVMNLPLVGLPLKKNKIIFCRTMSSNFGIMHHSQR